MDERGNAYNALLLPLRRADSEIRWMLVALTLADAVGVGLVAGMGHGGLLVLIAVWIVGTAMSLVVFLRVGSGRYTGGGMMWFAVGFLGFLGLTGSLTLLGLWSGWLRVDATERYLIVQAIGVTPLVTSVVLMSRKLRASGR